MDYPDMGSYGFIHEDELDHARDHLQGVFEALYQTGDTEKLESCLEEVAHALGLILPECELAIEKKNKNRELHYQLGYQRALLDYERKVS